jgi:starch synthase
MAGSKVLFVSQEITPYLPESEMSLIGRNLPQGIQEKGREIRTFMPKFGCINERRNQLHEVIRLSGMNIIIDDTDHPLIIKVASIQTARMQIYFIDNEDYFQRKFMLQDEKGDYFEDNDERTIFFARGVAETVKKLQWAPDLIHCHSWFSALLPVFVKKVYHDDPIFHRAKIVLSIYNNEFPKPLNNKLHHKLIQDDIPENELAVIKNPTYVNLYKMAISMADGIILGSEDINTEIVSFVKKSGKPMLSCQPMDNYIDAYSGFYDQILNSNN